MKTHLFLISTVGVLGVSFLTTSYAAPPSEYIHFTRHRDSNGKLLMGPSHPPAEPSVMQKTMMPAQPKAFEQRSTDWGMGVQEVKENEPIQSSWELQSPLLADLEKRVGYHTQIEGVDAALTYTFYQDHLGQAKYVFEPQHEDAADYLQDFHTLKGWISQSYGVPTSAQEIWLDTLYQYDKSLWGQAIKRGHLVMVAEWKTPGTDIVLVLDGGDDTVGLVADFSSTTYVVPVSFDSQNSEQNSEETMDETTIQEALSGEPDADEGVENLSVEEMPAESGASGEFHPETEVASQGPVSGKNELEEIEQLLNEEYPKNDPMEPAMEDSSLGSTIDGPMLDEAAIESDRDTQQGSMTGEEVVHETLAEHPMAEQLLMDEKMGKDHPIQPSIDLQSSENTMNMSEAMPGEPSREGQAMEAHPTDESVLDMSEAMPIEPTSEEQTMESHPAEEHATGHVMESETELDPQHL